MVAQTDTPALPAVAPRVLILSTDVAGGHDAAAARLAEQIHEIEPSAQVTIENGLEAVSPRLRQRVRDGYRKQLTRSQWSYRLGFWFVTRRPIVRLLWAIIPQLYGARMCAYLAHRQADVVVSTYPMITTILGGVRSSGKLQTPVVALISDPDPHGMWLARGIDRHLVCAPNDVRRVHASFGRLAVQAVRPPVDPAFDAPLTQEAARTQLGLPLDGTIALISGGAWALGGIERATAALLQTTDAHCYVLCGDNDPLRKRIATRFDNTRVVALAQQASLAPWMAACDLLVHTAAGMTAFEAIVSNTPLAIFEPLAGHATRSARALVADGFAAYANDAAALARLCVPRRQPRAELPNSQARADLMGLSEAACAVLSTTSCIVGNLN